MGRPPLFRACLLQTGADEHLFLYVFHHIASDAWSLDVAVREVAALYPAFLEGRPSPLPELPLQYADFAWQQIQALQGEALAREVGFWRRLLAGAAPLELPGDRPRPAVPAFRGNSLELFLPAALETGLRRLARESSGPPPSWPCWRRSRRSSPASRAPRTWWWARWWRAATAATWRT